MRKRWGWALALVVVLGLGAWLGSPWYAAWQLRQAAQARDAQALTARVDFEAVRVSVRQQLGDQLGARLPRAVTDSPLGALIQGAVLGKAVDAVLSPEVVVWLMQGRLPDGLGAQEGGAGGVPSPGAASPPTDGGGNDAPNAAPPPFVVQSLGYDGLNRFVIALRNRRDQPVSVVLGRRGWLDWQVVDVRLPPLR